MDYIPPIDHMVLTLKALGFETEDYEPIFEEAGKLAANVLAPLNKTGDEEGLKVIDGAITMPKGFKEAYDQYRDGGWNAVPFDEEWGGMALPWAIAFPIQEMWQAANMSFGLCPLLNQGAIEAIYHHGSDALKAKYLEKLISGEWTGTMNLTEPQAGSDLSIIKSKAEPQSDGTYRISGQKIFITYGEHDLAENIIHLVLARTPDAPEGTKGISLFVVPKFLEDGTRNDVTCVSTEHKLGIHASPTCTMSFGDQGGATGYLVGEENSGLKYMFTMMNNARLSVGLQGIAISDRAYQHARAYAQERVQGNSLNTGEKVKIVEHPDVVRMLMTMRVLTEAGRAMAFDAALALDASNEGNAEAQAKVDVLTPIVKSWCTDNSVEIASLGVQVHGGMGFVEETGAAQYLRDARILPIYEGTNGIQALDLVFRKMLRDGGATVKVYIEALKAQSSASLSPFCDRLLEVTESILSVKDNALVAYIATPYLQLMGTIIGGVMLEKLSNTAAGAALKAHYASSLIFYKDAILPRAYQYEAQVKASLQNGTVTSLG